MQDILYKVDGEPVERLPSTTGVYRFFSEDNALLYVGKTIDFRARIRAHYQTARKEARHAKMMQGVARIECETTSSELTALLFESRAVKIEQPLFNRRLRKKRQLWSARLAPDTDGYLGVYPQKLTSIDQLQSGYGLFSNQTQLKNWLRNAAAEHRLCVQRIGLDRGKGRCFGRQINRCDGACTGEQSAQQFNDVLADILYRYQLAVWPYTDPIWIRERDANRAQQAESCKSAVCGESGENDQNGRNGQSGESGQSRENGEGDESGLGAQSDQRFENIQSGQSGQSSDRGESLENSEQGKSCKGGDNGEHGKGHETRAEAESTPEYPGSEGNDGDAPPAHGDWHVFHYWTYLGSHSEPQAIDTDISDVIADGLDRDAYRILLSFLRNEKLNLYQFDSKSGALKPIDNRFA